jgi:replicative DNA helicase
MDMKFEKPQSSSMSVLVGSARILRADNGAQVSSEELYRNGGRPLVWTFDERMRLVPRRLVDVNAGGCREGQSLRLASGRQLEATPGSQFATFDGWRRLGELTAGDRVAVVRRVPEPLKTQRMADDEVVLLAHMIGDGSCIKRQPIRYASIDEENLIAVTKAAKHFGVTAKRDEYPAARVTTLRLPAPYHLTHGKRNPIAAWLDGLGLFDKRSYDKFVPAEVFAAPNDQIALFLRHLWATDGCVKWDQKVKQGRIYYASTSERLTDDVRQLLLRLRISTRAYRVPQGEYRDIWNLHISGVDNQLRFLRLVDVHGEKFFDVREVFTNLAAVESNANVDTVPREVWEQVRQGLAEQRMSHRAFAEAMQTKFCGSTMWKHSPSRGRLHRAAAVLDKQTLHDFTTNDVFWDKVVEIKNIGVRDVFDVSVEGAENYVAQGICVRTAV